MEELICGHESALHTFKNPYEDGREVDILLSSVRRIAKHDLKLKIYKRLSGPTLDGTNLFSMVDSNKLRCKV